MYYYHSLTYILTPGEHRRFLGADLGMEHLGIDLHSQLLRLEDKPASQQHRRPHYVSESSSATCLQSSLFNSCVLCKGVHC